ncbi:hypothetical protein LTS10_007430 [Elasticomyces elasticus]|nr:hypothetical protein LTS10_007430 [Elasticomyces elasticus]
MPPKNTAGAVKRPAAPASSSAQPPVKKQSSIASFFGLRGTQAAVPTQLDPAESSTPATSLSRDSSLLSAQTGDASMVVATPAGHSDPRGTTLANGDEFESPVEGTLFSGEEIPTRVRVEFTAEDFFDAGFTRAPTPAVPAFDWSQPTSAVSAASSVVSPAAPSVVSPAVSSAVSPAASSDESITTVTELRSSNERSPAAASSSAVALCFRSLMISIVQSVIDAVPLFIAEDERAPYLAFSAVALVKLMIEGMPDGLIDYIDECLAKGEPWDIRKLMLLLHPRESTRNRIGCYMIALMTTLNKIHTYVGSSGRLTQSMMFTRIAEHFNPSYRARSTSKPLYQNWDRKSDPVLRALCGAIFFLPLGHLARHSIAPLVILETSSIAFFTTPHDRSTFVKVNGLVEMLFPRVLLDCFANFIGSTLPKGLSDLTTSQVVARALAKTSGAEWVVATNSTAPISEMIVTGPGLTPLIDGGLQRQLLQKTQNPSGKPFFQVCLAGVCSFIIIGTDTYPLLLAAGLDLTRPHISLELLVSDEYDPENFAQVSENTGSLMNPEGFEDAHRLRLQLSFVKADNTVGTFTIKRAKSNKGELERACHAMSIYDYARGILPRATFGPRRVQFGVSEAEHKAIEPGLKVWEEEREDAERPFECKHCHLRTPSIQALRTHLGLVKGNNRKPEDAKACRESASWGKKLVKGADLSEEDGLASEHSEVPQRPMPYKCRACGVGFISPDEVRKHLGSQRKPENVGSSRGRRPHMHAACAAKYTANGIELFQGVTKATTGAGLPSFD